MSTPRTGTANTPQVHVTRRGRALLLMALVAVLFGAFSLGRANSQAASTSADPVAPRAAAAQEQITVQPGESLWALARRVAPENDPREVMAQIRRLNELDGSGLQVGQQLLLPAAA